MKNLVIAFFVFTTVMFGGYFWSQRQKTSQTEVKVAELEAQLSKRQDADAKVVAKKEKQVKELRGRLNETTAVAAEKSTQVSQLEQALTAAKTNSTGNPLAEMMKSPEMREMIKTQQKNAIGGMVDKGYAALFKELNLNPEQTAALKDLIMKKSLDAAEMGMSMVAGNLDDAQRKDLGRQIKETTDATTAQIKQFLGDQNYPQFEAYEKTLTDRMQVGTFKDQLALGNTPLSPTQESQLIQALSDERQGFKFTTDYTDQSKFTGDMSAYFSEDRLAKLSEEMAQLDQRSLARAQQILTPEQYEAFAKSQATQRDMQMMGLKMAAQMFKPKKDGN